ncbi:hypothetical protein D1AOALGA4SA_10679 [Olavius algarvensis Delta 1 endosymbiont]|nr:hypothetical protein D1AOALGA4SA_10679 [Olavius algarvensis Delta 1 endosymbiont]
MVYPGGMMKVGTTTTNNMDRGHSRMSLTWPKGPSFLRYNN